MGRNIRSRIVRPTISYSCEKLKGLMMIQLRLYLTASVLINLSAVRSLHFIVKNKMCRMAKLFKLPFLLIWLML